MPNVLIICTANICRSPVAEAVLRYRLEEEGLENWEIGSAGTWAYPGQYAAEFSRKLMAEQGLDISNHASRIVSDELLENSDLGLCMAQGHIEALRAEFPKHREKIFLLSEMSDRNHSVADPYGGPLEEYVQMVREVSELIDSGLPRIISLAAANEQLRLGQSGADRTN
jgi:protein-tyrosine-phosphatase